MNRNSYLLIITLAILTFSLSGGVPSGVASPADATATLTGVVKFEGIAPKPSRIDMSADPLCAKAHATPATTEDIVVDDKGGLANVVIYVSDGLAGRTFQPPQQPAVFEQKGCQYKPHVLAMQANQKLEVVNSDETTHNIHPNPINNREWNMTQPHGVPLEQTFAREEIAIPVKCNVHPWMRGYIAVFKHPYFAVSEKNGSFEVKNLPPGTYTITAWQEKLGTLNQKITVSAGESKTLDFTFKQ
ncbi:MAG TPA: carboxypeptidase regulatory-like domain-containing protein [Candidatus Sulfotelmatobacter sp.]